MGAVALGICIGRLRLSTVFLTFRWVHMSLSGCYTLLYQFLGRLMEDNGDSILFFWCLMSFLLLWYMDSTDRDRRRN